MSNTHSFRAVTMFKHRLMTMKFVSNVDLSPMIMIVTVISAAVLSIPVVDTTWDVVELLSPVVLRHYTRSQIKKTKSNIKSHSSYIYRVF